MACPCALGLASPTAVLGGTSLGAKRGLLLQGDVLETFSEADVIEFDKTWTSTIGKPVVTRVVICGNGGSSLSDNNSVHLSEVEILKLAVSVESNTIHPVGKAILEAAHSFCVQTFKAADGTLTKELVQWLP